MAARWEVVLPERPGTAQAAAEAMALFQRLDLELSEWKDGSPLSAVNRAAGVEPVVVPPELFSLLEKSLALGKETDGAFDVSWAALWGLWDFRSTPGKVPGTFQIEERRALVDYRRVQLDAVKRTAYLPVRGMKLGLGGIGKGYALDRAAESLSRRGFTDFLLVGGGQVLAKGTRSGRPWRVGIRDPRGGPEDFFARVELSELSDGEQISLSTSADNEAYFEAGGVRYHHILDPRTGWPSRGLRSATVLHREATVADALSTALMVLGQERGFAVVERLGGEALVVDERGDVATTAGLAGRIETLHPPTK